ncbi:PBSX family phage terminase large subunit [Cellulomonas hominis]|uniref:PBSX family phage terminase large subunit n=1 Tax=Cellulomonas hominis TaxID=156981 RepID=A0A7Z8K1P5_9CELL|nr:phage terminase large subunit [Cellulomonas hominis]TKR27144.1 PBSX family phage terminase large subunit [Cellulomonas hominis]
MPLSPKQVLSCRESTARINVWEGSVRSGKTIASLLRWLLYVATSTVRGELVVVSRTRDSAARNVFAPLTDPALFGPIAHQVQYTAGAPTATILGRTVWVLGSSDTRSENVLRGLTCAGAYVDEVTLLREDFFTQLLNRLWQGARLFGTTNPDNPAHWLKRRFLDRLHELPDWRTWKFVLDDNPVLSEERKAAIRRENTGLYYRRNVLGEWVAAEGAIYDMWDPGRHVTAWEDLPPLADLIAVGVDYGTTNATAALLLGVTDEVDPAGRPTSRLVLVDEFRYDSATEHHRLTDAQLSTRLRSWLDQPHTPYPTAARPRWVALDPSAASFRVQLQSDGLAGLVPAENDVAYGIRTVASLLGRDQLVVTDRCRGFIAEAPGYSWDPKATEKGEDRPLKVADHSLDGARYAVATTERLWRPVLDLRAAA